MAAAGGHWKAGSFVRAAGGLTGQDRDGLRTLQDRLVKLAESKSIDDSVRISQNAPASMTVGNLRRFIYPGYEETIRAAIRALEK